MREVFPPQRITGCARPKVSVVMAIRNEETFGSAAIESILNQTFDDFEFIIIDDASTDTTPEMLADFAAKDGRIKVHTNERNLSVPLSANKGLAMATGEYIARMDSDDIAFPHRFDEQVGFLNENPEYIIVGGGIEYIDKNGDVFRTFDRGSNWWEFEWASFFRAPLAQPCAMFRADAVRKHNLFYDQKFDRAEDFEYWHRILRFGRGRELSGVHLQYRIHDRNVSVVHKEQQQRVARRAAEENIQSRYSQLAKADVSIFLDVLYSAAPVPHGCLKDAIVRIGEFERLYINERNLSAQQADDIRKITAKILLKVALRFTPKKNTEMFAGMLHLLRHYFPDYCAISREIIERRSRLPRAI